MRPFLRSLLVLLLLLAPAAPAAAGDLVVSAAASLTNALSAVRQRYEAAHPGERVTLNFGSAGALLRQMESGAPVDVFCSADQQFMDQAQAKGLIDPATRRDFARNVMVLAAPGAAAKAPAGLNDLAGAGVQRVALGNLDTTPIGREARALLTKAGLWERVEPKLVLGETVRQVLDYLSRGEVDAGFVFATDAFAAGMKVRVVQVMEGAGPFLYPAAVARSSKNPGARTFVDLLSGPQGQEVLRTYGFMKP